MDETTTTDKAPTEIVVGAGRLSGAQARELASKLRPGPVGRYLVVRPRQRGQGEDVPQRWPDELLVHSEGRRGPRFILRDALMYDSFVSKVEAAYGWWARYCALYPGRAGYEHYDYDTIAAVIARAGLRRSALDDDMLRRVHEHMRKTEDEMAREEQERANALAEDRRLRQSGQEGAAR